MMQWYCCACATCALVATWSKNHVSVRLKTGGLKQFLQLSREDGEYTQAACVCCVLACDDLDKHMSDLLMTLILTEAIACLKERYIAIQLLSVLILYFLSAFLCCR